MEATQVRVLCIGDSFGLPRPDVKYKDTWIAGIKIKYTKHDFITLFRRQATTTELSAWEYGEYLKFYDPDYVYIQLGICDCSPRYLRTTSLLYKILTRLPGFLSRIFWKIIKLRGRRLECTDVSKEAYYLNLNNYINKCRENGVKRIILCKIGRPSEKMVSSNPHVAESVGNFNTVIDRIYKENQDFVIITDPLRSGDESLYVSDGYHPNERGHDKILESIIKAFEICQISAD